MTFSILMAGILLAAFIFGATLYALLQAIRTKKRQRIANLGLILGTIGGMAAVQYFNPIAAMVAGCVLVFSAAIAVWYEGGLSKFLPVILGLFGAMLVAGLPFNL